GALPRGFAVLAFDAVFRWVPDRFVPALKRRRRASCSRPIRAPLGAVALTWMWRCASGGIQHSPQVASFLSGKNRYGRLQHTRQTYRYGPLRYGPLVIRRLSLNPRPQHRQTAGGRLDPICHRSSAYPTGDPTVIFVASASSNPDHLPI